jgi:hypothetical protein
MMVLRRSISVPLRVAFFVPAQLACWSNLEGSRSLGVCGLSDGSYRSSFQTLQPLKRLISAVTGILEYNPAELVLMALDQKMGP